MTRKDITAAVYIAKKEGGEMESSEDVFPLCAPLAGSVGGRIFAGGRRRGKEVTTAALSAYFLENIGGPRAPNALQELPFKKYEIEINIKAIFFKMCN